MFQRTNMASLRIVLVFVLCSFYSRTWAMDTSDGLTIVGGQNISIKAAPYMAALYSNSKFICGGSIIHKMFVLTSAHCIRESTAPRYVIIGADRLKADHNRVTIGVQEEFCHRNYDSGAKTNDICVLKLKEPIIFGPKIGKVALPSHDDQIADGLLVNVTGWGVTNPSSHKARAKQLQKMLIATVSNSKCIRYYPNLADTLFCAGLLGKDVCRGDDGGPVTLYGTQIGLVSYENGCDRAVGVYTKVAPYVSWIDYIISTNL